MLTSPHSRCSASSSTRSARKMQCSLSRSVKRLPTCGHVSPTTTFRSSRNVNFGCIETERVRQHTVLFDFFCMPKLKRIESCSPRCVCVCLPRAETREVQDTENVSVVVAELQGGSQCADGSDSLVYFTSTKVCSSRHYKAESAHRGCGNVALNTPTEERASRSH